MREKDALIRIRRKDHENVFHVSMHMKRSELLHPNVETFEAIVEARLAVMKATYAAERERILNLKPMDFA